MGRILIAEDDPHASEMIARICKFRGHDTTEARDALQAVSLFDSYHPDLVISDLAMPLGGGQHLVRTMRTSEAGRTCPVIFITGYAAALGEEERASLAPCTVLPKPLELEPMLRVLDEAFALAESPKDGPPENRPRGAYEASEALPSSDASSTRS